jgi:serine protease Do
MNPLEQFSDELESLVGKASRGVVAITHRRGNGTGLVLTDEAYILTNAHVVKGTRSVTVRFFDGSEEEARVVGSDPPTDLALLRASARSGFALPLAPAAAVKVGQVVVAVGHPFGFERSVSLGVVSALERRLPNRDGSVLDGLIQTDAAINPGNSGGPLLNVRGLVVGVNTAMLPFAQGIGFAVPSTTATWVAGLLLKKGEVRRRFLGIAARNEHVPVEAISAVGQERAVRVLEIGRGSPADTGGVQPMDLLLSANGQAVHNVDDLQRLLATDDSSEVKLGVWRSGERRERIVLPSLRVAA